MKTTKSKLFGAMTVCGLAVSSIFATYALAQQGTSVPPSGAPGVAAPMVTTDKSLSVEHDRVKTSAEHHYNSPAERANDDLLITEVKSSLADRGISDGYPVAVDCDHGTIQLSGVVKSAADAAQAQSIAMSTSGVVGVKNQLTWR